MYKAHDSVVFKRHLKTLLFAQYTFLWRLSASETRCLCCLFSFVYCSALKLVSQMETPKANQNISTDQLATTTL